jgi:hypothetical protein
MLRESICPLAAQVMAHLAAPVQRKISTSSTQAL